MTSSLQRCIVFKGQLARNIAPSYSLASCARGPTHTALLKRLFLVWIPSLGILLSFSLVFYENRTQLPQRPDVPFYVAGCPAWGLSYLRAPDPHFFTYRSCLLAPRLYKDYHHMIITNFSFSQKSSFGHCLSLSGCCNTIL